MNEDTPKEKLKLSNAGSAPIRTLLFTTFAFFLTFVLWFSHAPMRDTIMETFNLTTPQWKALLILNVALTIPSRILVGILVDKLGPRLTYSCLLYTSPSPRDQRGSRMPSSA